MLIFHDVLKFGLATVLPSGASMFDLKSDWKKILDGTADDVLILDTETTGLDDDAEAVEVGIIDVRGATVFETLLRSRKPISPGAAAVNGLTEDMLATAPKFPDIIPGLRQILTGKTVFIYHADFDCRILRQSARAWDAPWAELFSPVCLREMYFDLRPGCPKTGKIRHRLTDAAEFFRDAQLMAPAGVPHRAVHDCHLALTVLRGFAGIEAEQHGFCLV